MANRRLIALHTVYVPGKEPGTQIEIAPNTTFDVVKKAARELIAQGAARPAESALPLESEQQHDA